MSKRLIGLALLVAAVAWSLRGVDRAALREQWRAADPLLAAAVLGLSVLDLLARSAAWRELVLPVARFPLRSVFAGYVAGVFWSLFLPFKMGDVAQGHYLGRDGGPGAGTLAMVSTVLVRRVLEAATLLLVLAVFAAFFPFPFERGRRALRYAAAAAVALPVLVLALAPLRRRAARLAARAAPRLSREAARLWTALASGGRALRRPRVLLPAALLLLASWGIEIAMIRAMAQALDIRLGVSQATFVLLVVNLGLVVPVTPGNLGTYQVVCILALSFFAVPKADALGFAVLFQALQFAPVVGIGAPVVLRQALGARRAAREGA